MTCQVFFANFLAQNLQKYSFDGARKTTFRMSGGDVFSGATTDCHPEVTPPAGHVSSLHNAAFALIRPTHGSLRITCKVVTLSVMSSKGKLNVDHPQKEIKNERKKVVRVGKDRFMNMSSKIL